MKYLLEDQTTDTTGDQDSFRFSPSFNNGKGAVQATGTFDTCTVKLEFSPDRGDNWYEVTSDTTFTSPGWSNFELQGIVDLRGSTISSGASTSVSLVIL